MIELHDEIKRAKEAGLTHRAAELEKLKAAIPFKVVYSPADKWAGWVLAVCKPEKYPKREYIESHEMIAEMQSLELTVVDAMMRMAPMGGFGLMYLVTYPGANNGRPWGEFTYQFLPTTHKVNHEELFKND